LLDAFFAFSYPDEKNSLFIHALWMTFAVLFLWHCILITILIQAIFLSGYLMTNDQIVLLGDHSSVKKISSGFEYF
jgi:hypothetical protein